MRCERPLGGRHMMKLPRRIFLYLAAGSAALSAVSRFAWAQAYPTRPMSMIVPFAAGGPQDVLGRLLAQRMSEILGQQIVVENIGGAAAVRR
jgi:tripartite-type tricarboxylate transporter receptor subunit TctC